MHSQGIELNLVLLKIGIIADVLFRVTVLPCRQSNFKIWVKTGQYFKFTDYIVHMNTKEWIIYLKQILGSLTYYSAYTNVPNILPRHPDFALEPQNIGPNGP